MTGRSIVTDALQEIGVVGFGQTPAPELLTRGLAWLQRFVDAQGADRLAMFTILRTVKALTSGTRDYTIGTGGAINIARPTWIDHAAIILNNAATDVQEIPIRVFTDDEWTSLSMKTLDAGSVQGIYFDHGAVLTSGSILATISTYPTINTTAASLVIYTPVAPVGFVDADTDYGFPPGYQDAYHYEIAYRLQRPMGRPLDPELKEQRDEAWRLVGTTNVRMTELVPDCAGLFGPRSGLSNIYTGS